MSAIKTATFRGKRFRVSADRRLDGVVAHEEIMINANLEPYDYLETAIHEGLHAALDDHSETVVAPAARDIARFLWRLGYRKEK